MNVLLASFDDARHIDQLRFTLKLRRARSRKEWQESYTRSCLTPPFAYSRTHRRRVHALAKSATA